MLEPDDGISVEVTPKSGRVVLELRLPDRPSRLGSRLPGHRDPTAFVLLAITGMMLAGGWLWLALSTKGAIDLTALATAGLFLLTLATALHALRIVAENVALGVSIVAVQRRIERKLDRAERIVAARRSTDADDTREVAAPPP